MGAVIIYGRHKSRFSYNNDAARRHRRAGRHTVMNDSEDRNLQAGIDLADKKGPPSSSLHPILLATRDNRSQLGWIFPAKMPRMRFKSNGTLRLAAKAFNFRTRNPFRTVAVAASVSLPRSVAEQAHRLPVAVVIKRRVSLSCSTQSQWVAVLQVNCFWHRNSCSSKAHCDYGDSNHCTHIIECELFIKPCAPLHTLSKCPDRVERW